MIASSFTALDAKAVRPDPGNRTAKTSGDGEGAAPVALPVEGAVLSVAGSTAPTQMPLFGLTNHLRCRHHDGGMEVDMQGLIAALDKRTAARVVVANHYLHRKPPISWAFGIYTSGELSGVVTYGTPASRHLQMSACPSDPSRVIELNRLWLDDALPKNSESWFVSRTLKMLPPRIVVSYADPLFGHVGTIYRALNFNYAGWTDMDRKTPRFDYIPHDPRQHTREAFRTGYSHRRRRVAKVKYWTVTGNRTDRRTLTAMCGWPQLGWRELPPPIPEIAVEGEGSA